MMMGIMETDQDKMIDTVDYEGDMARICAKWKHGSKDNDYEFGASEMVKKRNINL